MEYKRNESGTDVYHDPHNVFSLLDVGQFPYKYLDIAYNSVSEDQKLDIYLPEAQPAKPLPVIVYIHGGGFEMGDRKYGHIHKLVEALSRGYAVASVSYRLSQESVFPAAVQDVRNSIRFLRKNAAQYSIDPDRIGVFGESAGGNLVALLAMDPVEPVFDEGIPEGLAGVPASVACCVDWFGVTDMAVLLEQNRENNIRPPHFTENNCPESRYFGDSLFNVPQEWMAKASPMTYVSDRMCPMLIEHGTGDFQVAVQQSEMLYDTIVRQVGRQRAELFLLQGAVHEDPRFESDMNMALVYAFFDSHLRKGGF